jgi:hypothetical protein
MTERTKIRTAEKQLNIGLDPEVKSGLERVALYNGRTLRRQAAMYVARGVQRDIRRIAK